MNYETHTYSLIVKPRDEAIYSEQATIIGLEDEGAGPYVFVEQHSRTSNRISIDLEEWPFIKEAIDRMLLLCQPPTKKVLYRHPTQPVWEWDGKNAKPPWMMDWIAQGRDPMDCLVGSV